MEKIAAFAAHRVDLLSLFECRTGSWKSCDDTIEARFLSVGVGVVQGSLDGCLTDKVSASNLRACTAKFLGIV